MSTSSGSRDYGRFDELAKEFAERYRRGERPSVQDYVDRLPEMAEESGRCSRPWSRSSRSSKTPATRRRSPSRTGRPRPERRGHRRVGTHPRRNPPGNPDLGMRDAARVPGTATVADVGTAEAAGVHRQSGNDGGPQALKRPASSDRTPRSTGPRHRPRHPPRRLHPGPGHRRPVHAARSPRRGGHGHRLSGKPDRTSQTSGRAQADQDRHGLARFSLASTPSGRHSP